MVSGIEATDFSGIPLSDIGVTIVRTAVTKTTDNVEGDETLTDGSTSAVTAYFLRKFQGHIQGDEGKIETGDAIAMVVPATTINVDDKITYLSKVYRVKNVILRLAGDTQMYKLLNLFLEEK